MAVGHMYPPVGSLFSLSGKSSMCIACQPKYLVPALHIEANVKSGIEKSLTEEKKYENAFRAIGIKVIVIVDSVAVQVWKHGSMLCRVCVIDGTHIAVFRCPRWIRVK